MMAAYKRLIASIKNIFNNSKNIAEPQSAPIENIKYSLPPQRIPRSEHILSRQLISKSALKVLYELHRAGYQAYLVGGGVRDVLLGQLPKDFDIVTNARPEQVKNLFHYCHLIGRRFVLAHVHIGRDLIEVATFRAHETQEVGDRVIKNGCIVRDNVYGTTLEEDAWRRDFTINALYYDISDFSVIGYANGIEDLRSGIVRLIGDPLLRYQEDPVRMLRALRFVAKLNFQLDPATAAPIQQFSHLLDNVNTSRLYEEMLKLFLTGHAVQSFQQLRQHQLFGQLFPQTEHSFKNPIALAFIEKTMQNTDERFAKGQSVLPAFLFAAFLWHPIMQLFEKEREENANEQALLFHCSQRVWTEQNKHVAIPRRIITLMQEIWVLQLRLTRRKTKSKRNVGLIQHPRFRASYDFLVLRANSGEPLENWSKFWARVQTGQLADDTPIEETPVTPETKKPVHRKRRPRKKNSSKTTPTI